MSYAEVTVSKNGSGHANHVVDSIDSCYAGLDEFDQPIYIDFVRDGDDCQRDGSELRVAIGACPEVDGPEAGDSCGEPAIDQVPPASGWKTKGKGFLRAPFLGLEADGRASVGTLRSGSGPSPEKCGFGAFPKGKLGGGAWACPPPRSTCTLPPMPPHAFASICSLLLLALVLVPTGEARAGIAIYTDGLTSGFNDWSWGGIDRDLASSQEVHSGGTAMRAEFTAGWSGLQLGNAYTVDASAVDCLRFWIHGGTAGNQKILVYTGDANAYASAVVTPAAGTWTRVDIPLVDLGLPRRVKYVYWFNNTSGAQPAFYVDDVELVTCGGPPTTVPTEEGPALEIDTATGRRPIDPAVYGMNFADEDLAAELALPVRRWGGNATTRYDWRTDTSNRASDWYFENVPLANDRPELLPAGSTTDRFVEQDRRTGTQTILTVPLIGWTPRGRAYACGYSVAKYGAQASTDPWRPDCGNGVRSDGGSVPGNDPGDTSVEIGPTFVSDWIAHLTSRFGTAEEGGVGLYELDNEPMLWHVTHRDVHPEPTSYDEMRDRTIAYATAVKGADPGAKTLGPAVWGWTAYFWSALDWASGGAWWSAPQDRLAHGNVPFLRWYLRQMRAYEQETGLRLLDYLDVHYYPQASGVALAPAGDVANQALRLRSTASLWDPDYVDESWIAEPVRLVPRLREWIDAEYPGTKLAITEYNWGGLGHANGALAQADVLGIFGREGVDLATLWDPPEANQPGAFAFRMYLSYDGAGGRFGDTSVHAASTDSSRLAIYGAERSSDRSLTAIVVNKTAKALTTSISLSGVVGATTAERWNWSADNPATIAREADLPVAGPGPIPATFPPSSITMLVIAASDHAACPTAPRSGCTPAAVRGASLGIRGGATPDRRSLVWRWGGAGTVDPSAFGDPSSRDSLDLCIYADSALALATRAPAAGTCAGRPCWAAAAAGFAYNDRERTPLGIGKLALKAGDRPRISVSAKGALLPDPGLPLTTPLRVQFSRAGDAACWEASFSTARRSDASRFRGVSD